MAAIKVSIFSPAGDGARFDHAYYAATTDIAPVIQISEVVSR